jgi:hypothetical protein
MNGAAADARGENCLPVKPHCPIETKHRSQYASPGHSYDDCGSIGVKSILQ